MPTEIEGETCCRGAVPRKHVRTERMTGFVATVWRMATRAADYSKARAVQGAQVRVLPGRTSMPRA
jgi:hypothetical protein